MEAYSLQLLFSIIIQSDNKATAQDWVYTALKEQFVFRICCSLANPDQKGAPLGGLERGWTHTPHYKTERPKRAVMDMAMQGLVSVTLLACLHRPRNLPHIPLSSSSQKVPAVHFICRRSTNVFNRQFSIVTRLSISISWQIQLWASLFFLTSVLRRQCLVFYLCTRHNQQSLVYLHFLIQPFWVSIMGADRGFWPQAISCPGNTNGKHRREERESGRRKGRKQKGKMKQKERKTVRKEQETRNE